MSEWILHPCFRQEGGASAPTPSPMETKRAKRRWSLLPEAIKYVVDVFEIGARKYGDYAWRDKPMTYLQCYDAMMRHLQSWRRGEDIDRENGQHHADAVAFYALVIREYYNMQIGVDDRG